MKHFYIIVIAILSVSISNSEAQTDGVWQAYYDSSTVYRNKKDCFTAVEWLEKGKIRLEQSLEAKDLKDDYILTLNDLGKCYLYMDDGSLISEYIDAIILTIEELPKKHPFYWICKNHLAGIYQSLYRYDEALPIYLEARENLIKKINNANLEYIESLKNLAGLYVDMGKRSTANPLFHEALDLTQRVFNKEDSKYAEALMDVATMFYSSELFDLALPLFKEARAIIRQNYGDGHELHLKSMNELAKTHQAMGQFEDALPLFIGALQQSDKEKDNYTECLINLAKLYGDMSSYNESYPLAQEALKITEHRYGIEHEIYTAQLNEMAVLYTNMGRLEEALPLYHQVLENTQNTIGKKNAVYGTRLNHLARLYTKMERYEEALPLFLESLENCKRYIGKGHSMYGERLNDLADLYIATGRDQDALLLNVEAVSNAKQYLGTEHSAYPGRLRNLAYMYRKQGRYEKALPLNQEAFEITNRILGKDHSADHQKSLNDLAYLYFAMDKNDEALPLYIEANKGILQQIMRVFEVSNQKNKEAFLETIKGRFETYHAFAHDNRYRFYTLNRMLYDNEIQRKGLVLNSTRQTFSAVRASGDTSLANLYMDWKDLRSQLARFYSSNSANKIAGIDSLERLANAWEEELVQKSSSFASGRKQVTWQNVRDQLAEGDLAIEFVHFHHKDKVMYSAMILTPESKSPKIISLFEQSDLEYLLSNKSVQTSSLAINDFYRGTKALKVQTEIDQGGLYDLIWKPLEKYTEGVKKIYYVPSGQLHQIAQSAIAHPEGGNLASRFELQQLNSTRSLAVGSQLPGKTSVALFGGIEFDYSTTPSNDNPDSEMLAATIFPGSSRSSLMERFSYLEGTEKEVLEIQSLFKLNQIDTRLATGIDASEKQFKSLSGQSPKVLHIATHGFFFPDIEYSVEEIERGAAFKYIDNPMFRAGLIFAGANYTWEHGSNPYEDEDGILTAYEISNMDLTNTDLVVLSACETGLGEIKGSEGVFGLQRAFKMAGVDYLIMSLWQVPDEETKEFMVRFYELWLGGEPIRDAFRETQREMAANYPDEPYKWAAFVLVE